MQSTESVIRRMTRLAVQHRAVNLSQGFTDEAPAPALVWGAIVALLGGTDARVERLEALTLDQLRDTVGDGTRLVRDALAALQNPRDQLNQYSFPFGLQELREAIARYTDRWYGLRPDPEDEVTVTLGATEALAAVLAGLCGPGDSVIVLQPFHEMYPAQSAIFGLHARYVTLRQREGEGWQLDRDELARAASAGARLLVLNTPHNPTGKVFTTDELAFIGSVAEKHDLLVVTDEIYEHITFDYHRHRALVALDGMRNRTIVINSISKTGDATGWRIGWVITPARYTPRVRGAHDTLVVQAPTPLQKAAARLLEMPDEFYAGIKVRYTAKRDCLLRALHAAGFRVTPPEGAYYLFADYRAVPALRALAPMDAAMTLIEQAGVASVPGDNFYAEGHDGDRYLRFAFCRSLATLDEAARRLARL